MYIGIFLCAPACICAVYARAHTCTHLHSRLQVLRHEYLHVQRWVRPSARKDEFRRRWRGIKGKWSLEYVGNRWYKHNIQRYIFIAYNSCKSYEFVEVLWIHTVRMRAYKFYKVIQVVWIRTVCMNSYRSYRFNTICVNSYKSSRFIRLVWILTECSNSYNLYEFVQLVVDFRRRWGYTRQVVICIGQNI